MVTSWRAVAGLLVAMLSGSTHAQARPRVAVVLEGGGALGFAHIGVLHYLEEHHVPVDLVVGTSMGGLVGGLYAIGNSPDQIEKLTEDIDWDQVLSGRTLFQDLNFRRKEDRIAFPNRLEFGLKNKKLTLPRGLNTGHQTGLVIDRATLAYPDDLSFDTFPIPFRCVATDITEGREKVFDKGSIAHALRATMAIPAVFTPVIIDGHFYTDGGAVDNLPVDVAKRAGADLVIAVYLDPGPINPAAYDSMFSIAARNISIMISANELRNMQQADILLTADLTGFTSASFTAGPAIIPKGYAAAEKKAAMLKQLSLRDEEWAAYLEARKAKIRQELPTPQFVEVTARNLDFDHAFQESLEQFAGKPVDPPAIERQLTRMTGTGVMGSVGYTLSTKNGRPGLTIEPYEKTYGPPFLNIGIAIDGSDPDNVLFGMAARLTFMNLGGYRSEWRNDAFFGSTYGVSSEYWRPLTSRSKWFVAPHLYAVSAPFNEYSEKERLAQYRTERDGFGADIGYSINDRSEVRFGEDLLWFKVVKKIADDPLPNTTTREAASSLRYRYYGTDNPVIPRSGFDFESTINWYRQDLVSFPQAEVRANYFHPLSKPASLFFTASGGTAFNTKVIDLGLQSFTLGGPLRLGAFGQNQLLGNQYFLLQAGYERKLLSFSPLVGEGLYGITLFEAGKVYGIANGAPDVPFDGSVALAARTAIGPIFIGASFGNAGYRKWWFGLGRIF